MNTNAASRRQQQASDKRSVLSMGIPSVLITCLIWFLAYQSPLLNNMMMKNNNYSNLMNNNNNNINHGHPMMMQHQKNPNIHPEHYNIKKSNNNGVPDDGAQYSSGMETLNGSISNADRLAFGLKCIFVASLLFPFIIQ